MLRFISGTEVMHREKKPYPECFLYKGKLDEGRCIEAQTVTEAYDAVIDLEAQIVAAHNDWMEFVEAENKNIIE